MLVDAGFGVGMHVKRKIDKVEGVIKGMTATQVNIEVGSSLKAVSADSFLKGDWRPSTQGQGHVGHAWQNGCPIQPQN